MRKEAKARIKINALLEEAGWRFFDTEQGKANIVLENNVKLTQHAIDAFGTDFETTKNGFVDFLLLDERGYPFVVLEAKSEDKNPLDGKEQARRYAQSLNVRFIILSNGNIHYFWDLERGNPTIITAFPTYESLRHAETFKPSFSALADEVVQSDYIVRTQYPAYDKDPRWIDEQQRPAFIKDNQLKFLRQYQLNAIHALQRAAKDGKDRYLFEMATGTGKTLISAAVIKLFLKTGNAKRVLFLVDRIELEDQVHKNFTKMLQNDFSCVIYKENKEDWRKAEIVVSTVQSLSFNNKYKRYFSPTDFDLIISDEAHRSISGNSRAVFEYFVGYKLGLTATPKDYLKNIDQTKLSEEDPRAWERRQLLDTYVTFGCPSGEPTFRYSLLDGVRDGYLVNPIVVDARTEITTQLLSDQGYTVRTINDDGGEEEQTFIQKDFERRFVSEETNRVFCDTFLRHALKDPISGEVGKSIVFCVSQRHAAKITQILNQLADQFWPGKYRSDFAVQVTSSIPDAQQYTINFANNNLNGYTSWLPGYKSSRTRVCVTVGMMTTGYDCQDVLNLCLMRPIFSPTDFIQIKGRGTRPYTFRYIDQDGEEMLAEKQTFKLFDFFANCEYFEEKYNYDEVLELPKERSYAFQINTPYTVPQVREVFIDSPDPLKTITETPIGLAGMKIDWKYFDSFKYRILSDPVIQRMRDAGDIDGAERYIKEHILNKPEEYFTVEKLRKASNVNRRLSLREIVEYIFGFIPKLKTKEELLDEECGKFISIYKPASEDVPRIIHYLKAYITDGEIRNIIEKKEYSQLATNPKLTLEEFKQLGKWRDIVPEYVKDYVVINTFL